MLTSCAGLVVAWALQAGNTHYEAGVATEMRYATAPETPAPLSRASLLALNPRIRLLYEDRALDLIAAYEPRAVWTYPASSLLHRSTLALTLRPSPSLILLTSATGGYGYNDFRLLIPPEAGATVPALKRVKYVNASASAGFEARLSARLKLLGNGLYLVDGGGDGPSRTVLPLRRGPSGTASLEWAASPADTLTSAGAAASSDFEPGPSTWTAEVSETWQHVFGPDARARLGVGGGFSRTFRMIRGEAGYQQDLPRLALQIMADARSGPYLDATTGNAYARAEGQVRARWLLRQTWRIDANYHVAWVLNGPQRGQLTTVAQVGATWAARRRMEWTMGLMGLWQDAAPDGPVRSFRQVSAYLGVTAATEDRL